MERSELLAALSIVDPAVAANDLIPVLTHYWFTGKQVRTYNDVIAISAPFETDFKGAIRGTLLHGVLSKSDSKDVSFTFEDEIVTIKSGRSKLKVPVLPPDSFLFSFPKPQTDPTFEMTEKSRASFVRALEVCLQSLSRRISEPQRMGVTVVAHTKKQLGLYSTDSVTLSAALIEATDHSLEGHVTLSKAFCENALKLAQRKGVKGASLYIDEKSSLLVFKDGVTLYGRLVDDPTPPDFRKIVASYLPSGKDNSLIAIPDTLVTALDRAHLVIHKSLDPVTRIKVTEDAKGKPCLRIHARSEIGEVTEMVGIEDHPDVSIKVDLSRFRECDLTKFDKIGFDSRCIVLASGNDMYHMLAVQGK